MPIEVSVTARAELDAVVLVVVHPVMDELTRRCRARAVLVADT